MSSINDRRSSDGVAGDLASTAPLPGLRLWASALVGGILAGVLAWWLGESLMSFFSPQSVKVTAMGATFDMVTLAAQGAVDRKNGSLMFGSLGAVLGLALGLAGAISRGSSASGALAGMSGAVLGAIAGATSGWILLGVYHHLELNTFEEFSRDLLLPTLVRGGVGASIGAAAGLAFGLGVRADGPRLFAASAGGMIGGILGAAIYELVGAWFFPTDNSNRPIPGAWQPRLLAMLLISSLVAACSAMAIGAPGRRKTAHVEPVVPHLDLDLAREVGPSE